MESKSHRGRETLSPFSRQPLLRPLRLGLRVVTPELELTAISLVPLPSKLPEVRAARPLTQSESARESWHIFDHFEECGSISMAAFLFKRVAKEA